MWREPSPHPEPPPADSDAAEPRRLRLVAPRFGAAVVGGAEALARSVAVRMAARGWRVSVLTTCALEETTWADALPQGFEVDEGVEVVRLPVAMARRPATFRQLSRGFFRLPPPLRPEAAWLAAQGPFSPRLHLGLRAEPWTPTLFAGCLYRTTVHGVGEVKGPRLCMPLAHDEAPMRLRSVGAALGSCDALWYATPEERTLLEAAHPAVAGLPAAMGNAGVEAPADADGARFRQLAGVEGDYLLYGGRATTGKGVEELLDGVRSLRRAGTAVQLVLTGEAGTTVAPEPGVVPLGRVDAGLRWDAIAGAAAVVVPSFHESLSLLALEAWALGRPALLNAVSPVLEGQARRSGGALAYRGPEELATAAARLLADPELARRLGEAGRAHVTAEYSWTAVLDRLEALVAVAAEGARARALR